MTKSEAINKLVNAAAGEIGYKAKKGKENKFAAYLDSIPNYYNGPKNAEGWGADWCDIFVDYMFLKTFGNPQGRKMLYQSEKSAGAGCEFSANYFANNGALSPDPQKGAQGFLGKRGDEYHTGIVESYDATTVTMIEGNAGGGNGEVKRITRNRSEFSGFGIPNWGLVVNSTPEPAPEIEKRIDSIAFQLAEKAKGVFRGEYGNGTDRVRRLGQYYDPVQWIVNKVISMK